MYPALVNISRNSGQSDETVVWGARDGCGAVWVGVGDGGITGCDGIGIFSRGGRAVADGALLTGAGFMVAGCISAGKMSIVDAALFC